MALNPPATLQKLGTEVNLLDVKEAKWADHKKQFQLELETLGFKGWVVVYIDRLVKRVWGWLITAV